MIDDANITFINSVNLWNEIYEKFPAIQDAAVKFQNVSVKGKSSKTWLHQRMLA